MADEDFDVVEEMVASNKIKQQTVSWMGKQFKLNLSVAEYETIKTKYKVIAKGWINLANPESDYDSQAHAQASSQRLGNTTITVYLQPNLYNG